MSAAIVREPSRSFPIWAILMTVGLLIDAVSLAFLGYVRSVDPAGLTPDSRMTLLALLGLGTIIFTIGLAVPLVLMVTRGGTVRGATPGSHRVVLGTTLLVVLVSNIPPTVYGLATSVQNLQTLQGFLLAALCVEVTLIGASYLRLIRSGQTTWKELGFDTSRIIPDLGRGVVYGLGAFVVSAALQAALDAAGVKQTQLKDFNWIRELDLFGFTLILLVGALGAPLAEELFFRGYVFSAYLREKGALLAYPLSGLVFASLHLNKEALLPIFVLGMMLSWMYRRSNSLIPPITAHALNNGVAFLLFYFLPSLA